MSLLKLANGTKYRVAPPTGIQPGMLRQRERNILRVTFLEGEDKFAGIKAALADPENTERFFIYINENDPTIPDEYLLPPVAEDGTEVPGPAGGDKPYIGYTILGQVVEEDVVLEPGTPTTPPVYGRQLSIELGERQYGE